MPYAINPHDGVRSYFEDWGGDGPPVLVYSGLADPLEQAQQNPLVDALAPEYRMIFADHRGHGRSDKPHDEDAYAMTTRVVDAVTCWTRQA
jgi:pimeloyl-ACP methyl ester carboxylesterase